MQTRAKLLADLEADPPDAIRRLVEESCNDVSTTNLIGQLVDLHLGVTQRLSDMHNVGIMEQAEMWCLFDEDDEPTT